MRVVENPDELEGAVEGARREAEAAFGDDTLFLERWLTATRHVEIQILGDNHGNLVHLFERECSIQRRHQKIIEEAPSPAVDDELRAAMGEAAVSAARRIGYSSAGTVEFLVAEREFFFLEVNTRLQVEHPVTEAITGLDLVREQLRIAEGEPLGYDQDELSINGHAIEARIYAEDPSRGFLPSPGTVAVWRPDTDGRARFDSGVESGTEVSPEFDPMIAKVIAHAPTRREAAARLARALERTSLQGLRHNRDFLVATLREPAFLAGDTTTDFIERVQPARTRELSAEDLADAVTAAVMCGQAMRRATAAPVPLAAPTPRTTATFVAEAEVMSGSPCSHRSAPRKAAVEHSHVRAHCSAAMPAGAPATQACRWDRSASAGRPATAAVFRRCQTCRSKPARLTRLAHQAADIRRSRPGAFTTLVFGADGTGTSCNGTTRRRRPTTTGSQRGAPTAAGCDSPTGGRPILEDLWPALRAQRH